MRGRGWWAGGVVVALLAPVGAAEAASGDADGTYTVTVTKIEVSKDAGATYTTVFSGSQAINIAAANAGATAAGLVSGAALAPGTYTRVRTTIGDTLSLKGYINISGSTYYTDGGSDSGAFTANGGVTDTPGSDYAISTFTIPADFRTNTNTSVSIAVKDGGASTCSITFDTSGVITNSGGLPSVGGPTITVTSS